MKSLALDSKVKSLALASRPQVLENWPVLGSRTAAFFELLKFCGALENFFGKRIFVEIAWKIFVKTFLFFFFFFWRSPEKFLRRSIFFFESALALVSLVLGLELSCPWPRECLSSERLALALALASDFFCVLGLGLEPCVLDSTSGRLHTSHSFKIAPPPFFQILATRLSAACNFLMHRRFSKYNNVSFLIFTPYSYPLNLSFFFNHFYSQTQSRRDILKSDLDKE